MPEPPIVAGTSAAESFSITRYIVCVYNALNGNLLFSTRQLMKRSKSHKINEKGMRIFEDALPENWVSNPQGKDYGKDYLIEIGDTSEEMTGDSFYVQLKSVEKAKLNKTEEFVSFSLQSRHARYFTKIKDLPVFLVVADNSTRACWYVFLQPVLHKDQSFLHKREIAIRIPISNSVSKHAEFLESVTAAKSWLSARHPTAVFDAVKAREAEIEAIDPRFKASLSYKNGTEDIMMTAKESVRISIQLKDETATKKFHDVHELGKSAVFESAEISISGSKIFENIDSSKIAMTPSTSTGTLVFSDNAKLSESTFRSCEFPANVRGGTKQTTFQSVVDKSPLEVEVVFSNGVDGKETPTLQIGFNPAIWEDIPICSLPFFSSANELFSHLAKNNTFYMQFIKDGNSIAAGLVEGFEDDAILQIHQLLVDILKAQKIFRKHNVNPAWNLDAFCRIGAEFDRCFELIENGFWKGQCSGAEITGDFVLSNQREIAEVNREGKKNQHLTLTSDMWFELLGEKIYLGRVAQEFSEVKLKVRYKRKPPKKKGRKRSSNTKDEVSFFVKASENCEQTMKFAKEGE